MKNRTYLFTCIGLLALVALSAAASNNKLVISQDEVVALKKSQVFLDKQLDLYEKRKSDYYTLYLAVKNYADRLYAIEVNTINKLNKQVQKTIGASFISKVFLASSKNNQIYSFAKESKVDSSTQILYFKKWQINLNKLFQIQDNPALAIVKGKKNLREDSSSDSSSSS